MQVHDGVGGGEPEAQAPEAMVVLATGSFKGLKDGVARFRREADAGVAHLDAQAFASSVVGANGDVVAAQVNLMAIRSTL